MSLSRPTGGGRTEEAESGEYCVLGGAVGAAVADQLRADGHSVELVDATADADDAGDDPLSAFDDDDALAAASTVVVATRSDSRNLLLAQRIGARFDTDRILVLVHDPVRLAPFAAAGHDPVCVTSALTRTVIGEL
jgi:trk system potassium uptake protein TrkA